MTPELFEDICRSALGHRTSQEQTYDLARNMLERGVPGDFVECGVFAGSSAALMAFALGEYNATAAGAGWAKSSAHVHLFDSFQGIPPLGPHDDPSQVRAGAAACSLEDCKGNMRRWGVPEELLVWHPGWFGETVPQAAKELAAVNRQIALLRLDGDLYDSTAVCMKHLYPLVSKGGYVIVDDYDLHGARYAVHETVMPAPVAWRKWT